MGTVTDLMDAHNHDTDMLGEYWMGIGDANLTLLVQRAAADLLGGYSSLIYDDEELAYILDYEATEYGYPVEDLDTTLETLGRELAETRERTHQALADAGIETVTLYRGDTQDPRDSDAIIQAWALSEQDASYYAPTVYRTEVPVSAVVSIAGMGLGEHDSTEVIIETAALRSVEQL